jgi:glyoxylase-like metal-dependent hydrolase (beta-lactamase superfamily II)
MRSDENIHTLGTATITRVKELDLTGFAPGMILPGWDPGMQADHPDGAGPGTMDAAREHILMSVHAWLLRDGKRTVLIDTGAGNHKERPYAPYFHHLDTAFLQRLRAAGVEPEDVDHVLLTHLHVDHVGWNTRLEGGQWVPTFPNAEYVFSRAEHDYFTDPGHLTERNRTSFMVQKDSVDPVIQAGLARMIELDGSEAIPGFTFHPTPGHTAAHASIIYRSGSETALFAGDLLHHPFQVQRPDWASVFDASERESLASRNWALRFAADHHATVFSSHFPASSAGRVARDGAGYHWQFT